MKSLDNNLITKLR